MKSKWRRTPLILGIAGCLTGCVRIPDTYAPPMDRRPVTGFGSNLFGSIVDMRDPSALTHVVQDISPVLSNEAWRWAGKRPELCFVVSRVTNVKLVMDFAIPETAFKSTGPVRISFFVNDRLLESVRYDEPGSKHYEEPVPAEWLRTDQLNTIAAEIDKVYVSPKGGATLGFILSRVGFAE